jgi:hypothetical protein
MSVAVEEEEGEEEETSLEDPALHQVWAEQGWIALQDTGSTSAWTMSYLKQRVDP